MDFSKAILDVIGLYPARDITYCSRVLRNCGFCSILLSCERYLHV